MSAYAGPLPQFTLDDQQFWEGCKRHQLLLQKCGACAALRAFGDPMCSRCQSREWEAVPASGRGVVWSWTSTYHPFNPYWKDRVPYHHTVVQLEEGPRLTTLLVDCEPDQIHVGMPVEVAFEDATQDVALPTFRPASG